MNMALKLGKLDAICARLKKTSAVDVKATTQNGVTDAAEVTEGHAKADDVKTTTTTNNNEETATDLNETPSKDATVAGASPFVASDTPRADDEELSSLPETQTIPVSTPTSTHSAPSTPNTQTSGSSSRRKRRKASKPRIVSQIQEHFDSDLYDGEEEEENSTEGFSFMSKDSSFLRFHGGEGGDDSIDSEGQMFQSQNEPEDLSNQYSLTQPESSNDDQFTDASMEASSDFSRNLSGLPLDLSTSKNSDDSILGQSSAAPGVDSSMHANDSADSVQPASAVLSPLAQAQAAVAHNAEAKVLADYAKNTMNELLSIYGFGGAGLEGVAQKHFVNLASQKAAAVPDSSPKGLVRPLDRIATKLLNGGQSVHKDVGTSADNLSVAGTHTTPTLVAIAPKPAGHVANPSGTVTTTTSTPVDTSNGTRPIPGDSAVPVTVGDKLLTKPDGAQLKVKLQHALKGGPAKQGGSGPVPQKQSLTDYSKYIRKFHNGIECGGSHCRDLGYRDHYHCHDCNFKVFVKKEEMVRHYKWHKKRDESLQHGFMRYSPMDDCSAKFGPCTHNGRQTHYHCVQAGCDKVYISTSDVQMHANYHRKDSAIIQEGFQRFRATEDCGTTACSFYGQRTTHFHCRRANCNFTFKNKADMEKHKSYHQKDEILGRDGFKKFMKYEHCTYAGCRFSKISNHIHCIRPGCEYVLHSTAQLYSHKRKHERREFESLYRTFRQTQKGVPIQPVTTPTVTAGVQTVVRQIAPTVANLPKTIVGSEIVTSIPVQAIGEPMVAQRVVAGNVVQPIVSLPIQLGATTAAMLPKTAATTLIAATKSASEVVNPLNLKAASARLSGGNVGAGGVNQAVTVLSTPITSTSNSTLSQNSLTSAKLTATSITQPISIKQEPRSDNESDSDAAASDSKNAGTSTLPSNLSTKVEIKEEKLSDSLNLTIPGEPTSTVKEENPITTVVKTTADASIGVNTSTAGGHLVTLIPRVKRVGAPEKRERDESWKNYLIRYTANDPCNSRCQLLYKDHYHCKIPGCQVLFRSKDGVREHAKFHDLQDRITPMVYDRYEELQACPQNCEHSLKEIHYHCNWTGCNHIIPESGPTFGRLEHYRIHEYAKAAAGKNYRVTGGQTSKGDDSFAHRRRGRPPKYPRIDVPAVPKVDLSASAIKESTRKFSEGELVVEGLTVMNGFKKFEEGEECPDDQCVYNRQMHYHCGRPRCHTATDRVDVLNLHAKDFHNFVDILEHFEFFDRNVNCRRAHCHNNQVNRHYHCIRPRCDYSFVRHSTMAQHDKKHIMSGGSASATTTSSPLTLTGSSIAVSSATRLQRIQWVKRTDGQHYIPIIPAVDPNNKNIVKAAGTFYPLSGLPGSVALTPAPVGIATASTITLSLPGSIVTAAIPVVAQAQLATALPAVGAVTGTTLDTLATNVVPVIAPALTAISTTTGVTTTTSAPLTVLLRQKSNNSVPQPSWSTMRQSMHFSLQASCGRPFCKLKKKDHYHCLECNQAFSDPARLRSHISKHGVKFKKMEQPAPVRPIKPVPDNFLNVSEPPDVGLDLSTAKSRDEDSIDGAEENEIEADDYAAEGEGEEDDENSMSMSLALDKSISSISNILPTQEDPSSPSMDASELNEEGALVIDEDAHEESDQEASQQHSLNSSMDGKDFSINAEAFSDHSGVGNTDNETADTTSDISSKDTTMSSPPASRRSSRKRTAPVHTDFINSDDAALAKQMKLKLSGPIPSTVTPKSSISSNSSPRGHVPEGFVRFHCSNDCGYTRCAYRQTVTHFHCLRTECGYGFSDKSRIIQHRLRHERIDKLMGDDFQQFRATVSCERGDCEFTEKASHFHCLKCAFVCADSSKVLAHRKYHTKMDNISNNGFKKFTGSEDCKMPMCTYCRKQTHYHCIHEGCNHAVLGPAQMAPHKLKHASHDV